MVGLIQEEHLAHHHLGQRRQLGEPHRFQFLGGVGAIGREVLENGHHIGVTGHHPGMQKGIPMHRILAAQPVIQRIRVGQHFLVQQVVQAQRRVRFARHGR